MCLDYVGKPESRTGYAYKVVRLTEREGVFKNFYMCAQHAEYRIGETYDVDEQACGRRKIMGLYKAGVHLYLEPVIGYHTCHNELRKSGTALILCKYEGAYAKDNEQIVARRVTPLRVLRVSL